MVNNRVRKPLPRKILTLKPLQKNERRAAQKRSEAENQGRDFSIYFKHI
jgi:hypothetical protein